MREIAVAVNCIMSTTPPLCMHVHTSLLDRKGVCLRVEDPVVERDDVVVLKNEIQVLQCLSEEEGLHSSRQSSLQQYAPHQGLQTCCTSSCTGAADPTSLTPQYATPQRQLRSMASTASHAQSRYFCSCVRLQTQ